MPGLLCSHAGIVTVEKCGSKPHGGHRKRPAYRSVAVVKQISKHFKHFSLP